ncbi:MAG: hypothetical protein BA869_08610 [Desulfuromonadales bacterium C00003107]|jgi:hypothetical protein|nr:MAG: hypothetical protein BA869_08610 [Desulfuromonadales bacterium C00003107]
MKLFRFVLIVLFVCLVPTLAMSQTATGQWDNLLDVTYRFSWYPQEDLQQLLAEKGTEYGQTLEGYRDQLRQDLQIETGAEDRIDGQLSAEGQQWKKYYHLSLAEFCLYLTSGEELQLENAQAVMGILSGKAQQSDVAFWLHLYSAYQQMLANNARGFSNAVYDLWQNVVLKLEVDNLRIQREIGKAGFVKSLPYLYENVAHLIIRRAIVEEQIPGLSPLGVIVLSIEDKLTVENGYRTVVEATVERMRGLNSDNYNLNFAVAFLEAIASRNAFEGEQNPDLLVAKYQRADAFYRLAWQWADSRKGKAAVLSQHMSFSTYVTRRLSDPDDSLAADPFFSELPSAADRQLDQAIDLYNELADPRVQGGEYTSAGFYEHNNYLAAMHKLWDSTAKLGIMLSGYYEGTRQTVLHGQIFPAESPLLKYLALFEQHAQSDADIVPDNAYFLAAFAAGELADLYRKLGDYSTGSQASELFFAYQLQAVEIFPIDIVGILQLAYQANQDGRVEDYFQYTSQIGQQLKDLAVDHNGSAGNSNGYTAIVGHMYNEIPQVMANAYSLVNFIQEAGGTEEGMYRKALAMNRVLQTVENQTSAEFLERLMLALGQADFSEGVIALDPQMGEDIPSAQFDKIQGILSEVSGYRYNRLKNELYASLSSPMHKVLRNLFYEVPYQQHQYPHLLESVHPGS